MEIFPYEDWLASGYRQAKARGNPDRNTQSISLEFDPIDWVIMVVYSVDLKTTEFTCVVESYLLPQFSDKFEALLQQQGNQ